MARNRKHQSAASRFGPALKAALLCLVIGGSAVGYVWQKDQVRQLGEQRVQAELDLKQMVKENDKRRQELWRLSSMANLPRLIERHHLGLVQPSPDQIVTIDEPAPASQDPLRKRRTSQLAVR